MKNLPFIKVLPAIACLALIIAIPAFGQGHHLLTVPGIADPWLAGLTNGTASGRNVGDPGIDVVPDESPAMVDLSMFNGPSLFFNVIGQVAYGPAPAPLTGPDGSFIVPHQAGTEHGISDISAPACSLLGVFLQTGATRSSAPTALDFTDPSAQNQLLLIPELQQVFFIGDGWANDLNQIQTEVVIPPGATHLYLGPMDGWEWRNNRGAFTVKIKSSPPIEPIEEPITVTVPGTADSWLSGLSSGSASGFNPGDPGVDFVPTESPTEVDLTLLGWTSLYFSAEGQVAYGPDPAPLTGPDGSFLVSHRTGAENGISDVLAPANCLLGVFMGPMTGPAPAALDFTEPVSRNLTQLTPELQQVFFIGDGWFNGGIPMQHEVVVPTGATRLYLGTMDGWEWRNNRGSFTVWIGPTPIQILSARDRSRK